MSALTEFLLARIAEDEAWSQGDWPLQEAPHWGTCSAVEVDGYGDRQWDDCNCGLPARILAECAAKREQVAQIIALRIENGRIARAMATVWADHPDYDPDWRL